MSIARLKKLSVIGRAADMDRTLAQIQELGVMHVLPLANIDTPVEQQVSREAEDTYKALRFLAVVPGARRQMRADPDFDVHRFVAEVLTLKDRLRAARDRRDFLKHRIETIRPWGDFTVPPQAELAHLRLWFYKLPVKQRPSLDRIDFPWAIVGQDQRFHYVVVLAHDEPAADLLPVRREHVGAKSIHALENDLEDAEIEIEAILGDRMARTRFLTLLRASLSTAETAAEFAFAKTQILNDPDLFALQGWVPEDQIPDIEDVCAANGLAVLIEAPASGETPPTLLEQPEAQGAGVDLALFYQVPSYFGWDPTRLLTFSFSLFFAMIVADAGYGLLILFGLLAAWRRLEATPRTRAWRRLGLVLTSTTIIFGALVGSYFGAAPADAHVMASLNVLDLNEFNTMMTLSIVIGVAHIAFANLMAFQANPARDRYANLGWILVLVGGLGIWLSGQSGAFAVLGGITVLTGIGTIVAFSSRRAVKTRTDWLWRVIDGLQRLTGLMGLFGDVLSYMRLFALGLASASLAITFNDLAGSVIEARSGLGLLGGLLILLIGHALNFGLAVMSGVVHGLRLNFIEFYKWGLPEEGIVFRAFSRKEAKE